ncbi:FixH family protein [Priestia megaterium]|nr:FixH family protein [Priestia megaterium]
MKFRTGVYVVSLCLLLAGCGQEEKQSAEAEVPKPLEVAIKGPELVNVNENVTFEAHVTYGKEKVKDADDVQFEVEKENAEGQGNMIEGKRNKEGGYQITTSFTEPGTYTVQSHVTAKGSHNMPKMKVQVQ